MNRMCGLAVPYESGTHTLHGSILDIMKQNECTTDAVNEEDFSSEKNSRDSLSERVFT